MEGGECCCFCLITYYILNCILFGGSIIKEYYEERIERNNQRKYNMVLSTILEEDEITQ